MALPPMNDGDKPVTQAQLVAELRATRADLRQEMADMRGELRQEMADMRGELRQEMADMRGELRQEIANAMNYVVETLGARMDRMRDELSRELAGHVKAASEENRRYLGALDDRYRDLPGRVSVLERELDEHRRDSALHGSRRRR
jgi:DNA anti-recombination protein RmuC